MTDTPKIPISYPETVVSHGASILFSPESDERHLALLERKVEQYKQAKHLPDDYRIEKIIPESHLVVIGDGSLPRLMHIKLSPAQSSASKGKEVQSVYEEKYPGYFLTEFDGTNGRAVLERLSAEAVTARTLIAEYLRTDVWNIKIAPRDKGGWNLTFAAPFVYQADRDDPKLAQAAVAVGKVGWRAESQPKQATAQIIPGTPATFKHFHPFNPTQLGNPALRDKTPIGVQLPASGDLPYEPAYVNWKESNFLLIGGEGGSGKSVLINSMLAHIIAQKPLLSIIDTKPKSTDYNWCRPWVSPEQWGCESIPQAAGVLNLLIEEMEHGERAQAWGEHGWQNWLDIPQSAKQDFPLHYIVIDEYASLVDEAKIVSDIPNPERKLPVVFERLFTNQAEERIRSRVTRILRTARAQGYRMILASQTINDRSGLGPTIRDLFGHHIVMGSNPSEAMKKGAFHDLASIPEIPEQVFIDGVAKGVGTAEISGAKGFIFKTCYAGDSERTDTQNLARHLIDAIGLPADIDRDRFLQTLDNKENPGVDMMRHLTERISLPMSKALASDTTLQAIKDAWDESLANHGGGSTGLDGDNDTPTAPVSTPDGPDTTPTTGAATPPQGFMSAQALADVMSGRTQA